MPGDCSGAGEVAQDLRKHCSGPSRPKLGKLNDEFTDEIDFQQALFQSFTTGSWELTALRMLD